MDEKMLECHIVKSVDDPIIRGELLGVTMIVDYTYYDNDARRETVEIFKSRIHSFGGTVLSIKANKTDGTMYICIACCGDKTEDIKRLCTTLPSMFNINEQKRKNYTKGPLQSALYAPVDLMHGIAHLLVTLLGGEYEYGGSYKSSTIECLDTMDKCKYYDTLTHCPATAWLNHRIEFEAAIKVNRPIQRKEHCV